MSWKQKIRQLAHDYKLAKFISEGGDSRALSNYIRKEELVPVDDVVALLDTHLKDFIPRCKMSDCINWGERDCMYGLHYRLKNCKPYKAIWDGEK